MRRQVGDKGGSLYSRLYDIYQDEWIAVTNHANRDYLVSGACSWCGFDKEFRVWYSLKTEEIRCFDCFDPRILPPKQPSVSEEHAIILNTNRISVTFALDCLRMMHIGDKYCVNAQDMVIVFKILKRMQVDLIHALEKNALSHDDE